MDHFELTTDMKPRGDQPQAIAQLCEGYLGERRFQTLLGVTGSGKTFTMAHVIAALNRPTLVISHNKTLAAQLYEEFKELFPRQRGRVLRQLLRLLPARGVHPAARHLHREGRLAQRRPGPAAAVGDDQPVQPPRRGHRGERLVHLRPGLAGGLQEQRGHRPRRHEGRPRRAAPAVRRPPVRRATTSTSSAARSASAATRSRSTRPTRSSPTASSSSATRSSGSS